MTLYWHVIVVEGLARLECVLAIVGCLPAPICFFISKITFHLGFELALQDGLYLHSLLLLKHEISLYSILVCIVLAGTVNFMAVANLPVPGWTLFAL